MDDKGVAKITDFLFEAGILSKTPRSGFHFLGSGKQSVAEHINRTTYVGYALAKMNGRCDVGKVIEMCLFHDFPEARTSDLNYVHQKYTNAEEGKVISDQTADLPFGDDIKKVLMEFEEGKSAESQLAKDADQLELILSLREQIDVGNSKANSWLPSAIKRLKTEEAKKLAEMILKGNSDHWWLSDPEDEWWVNRNKS